MIEKGDIIGVKYYDHFNATIGTVERELTQEQVGYYYDENELYLYISLSRHTYDKSKEFYDEVVGILKTDIIHIHTFIEFEGGE